MSTGAGKPRIADDFSSIAKRLRELHGDDRRVGSPAGRVSDLMAPAGWHCNYCGHNNADSQTWHCSKCLYAKPDDIQARVRAAHGPGCSCVQCDGFP